MNMLKKLTMAALLPLLAMGQAEAATVLKTGSWTFSLYPEPGQAPVATKVICLGGNNIWNVGPAFQGNRVWYRNGNEFSLYGALVYGGNQGTEIFSALGQLDGAGLITGRYANFNTTSASPKSHGIFKAVFSGAICPG